jgi:hypothetical protein
MARGIQDLTNVTAPDADYPDGNVKNAPNGTPVNVESVSDMYQFFAKMMREADITPNGLADNETNGYEFYDALLKASKPYDVYTVRLQQATTADPTESDLFVNEIGGSIVWSRSGVGSYSGTLVAAFPAGQTQIFCNVISLGIANLLVSRFDDDTLALLAFDYDGNPTDVWGAELEIRVYR